MRLSSILHLVFFFITFILSSLVLATIISPYIYVAPALGISECASFVNGTFDPNLCNVIPGSLLVIVLKNSPMFSYVTNALMIHALKTLSLYLLVLFVAFVTGAIIYYYKGNIKLSILFMAFAVASLVFAAPLLAPFTSKDIICYKTTSSAGPIIICHTLDRVEDGYVILKS